MQCSKVETSSSIIKVDSTDNWASVVVDCAEKETSFSLALHKMSQHVTVLLTTLELSQMTGKVIPEDLTTLLDSAIQLRDDIRALRIINNVNDAPPPFARLNQ